MTTISFNDTYPPSRNDGQPWTQMAIEESIDGIGSLGIIETKDLVTGPGIVPLGLDDDPDFPISRDWTSNLASLPLGQGFYRVRFSDALGNLSEYSEWLGTARHPWRPSLYQVAAIIRARAVDDHGNQKETFTNDTTPSAEEAGQLIDKAVNDLHSIFGDVIPDAPVPPYDSPEAYRKALQTLAATRTALLIEITVFGKEVSQGNSPYKFLYEDYKQQLLQLASKLGIVVPGITPTTPGGGTTIEGSHISIWGNEVTEPYTDMMTRPL